MSTYSVRGFTATTAATADHTIAELWNPDASKRIKVLEIGLFKGGAGTAGDSIYICRTTAKGTAGSTVTPDADNAWDASKTPQSACTLELAAFSSQPTKASPNMFGWVAAAVSASGFIWPTPRGLEIPFGTGLAIVQRAATVWPTSEVYFVWDE